MRKTCIAKGCDRTSRSRNRCHRHYQAWAKRNRHMVDNGKSDTTCIHLDCKRRATLRFTWPYPILRQEKHCRDHAETLLGSFVAGLTFEEIGAP